MKKVFIVVLPLVLCFAIAQQTQGQNTNSKERTVEKLSRKVAPFKVKNIKTKKGEFLLGQKLVDEDDWFNGLSIVLENISGKTVIYFKAGFLFPRRKGEIGKAPPLYKSLSYGRYPGAPEGVVLNTQPLAVQPGERFTVTLSGDDYNEITATLTRLEYDKSIKALKFNLEEVYFDDGTGWAAGTWLDHYPDSPRSYIQEQHPVSDGFRSVPMLSGNNFIRPAMFSFF